MARLSEADRNRIIGMLQAGLSKSEVAKRMNCTRATIYRTWARFQQLGNVRTLPRSGRPKVTTRNQDRYIRLTHAVIDSSQPLKPPDKQLEPTTVTLVTGLFEAG